MRYAPSRYNFTVQLADADHLYLFNCMKASLICIPEEIRGYVEELVNNGPFESKNLPIPAQNLVSMLIKGGFLVHDGFDELQMIRKRFNDPPKPRILSLTVVPTINCNLRCKYCYQNHGTSRMNQRVRDGIVHEVRRRLQTDNVEGLEVDWYGGEPLLELDIIHDLSQTLIETVEEQNVLYEATIATNGTLFDDEAAHVLSQARVNEVQITIDGPPSVHNAHRPFAGGKPSFDAVMDGILCAATQFPVILRINVDSHSVSEAFNLLDILDDNGCFAQGVNIRPYIAMIGPLSPTCAHNTCAAMIPLKNFFGYVLSFQREVLRRLPNPIPEEILEFPRILTRACGAQSEWSICIHPSGQVYKCGLEIDDPNLGGGMIWEPYWRHPNYKRWIDYDPFARSVCRDCLYLPLCMGGCQKYNFVEGDFFRGESCIYWNNYLEPIIKQWVKVREKRL